MLSIITEFLAGLAQVRKGRGQTFSFYRVFLLVPASAEALSRKWRVQIMNDQVGSLGFVRENR